MDAAQQCQASPEDIRENRRRCWKPQCLKTAWIKDWAGWNWCIHHAYWNWRWSGGNRWLEFTKLEFRWPF